MSPSHPPEDGAFEEAGLPLPVVRRVRPGGKSPAESGHGTRWIVTYSDMITLLIAFFIAIITFSSKGVAGKVRSGPSLLTGPGGSGVAGPAREDDIPCDAVILRPRFSGGPKAAAGSEFAPLYHDPAAETTEGVLKALANAAPVKVGEPYTLRLPFGILFGSNATLTPSGMYLLRTVAANLRDMPYDFHLSVRSPLHISRAVRMGTFLSTSGGIHPGRIGVGVRVADGDALDTVLVEFTPQL
jgi:hypothetical protein